jgi:two-component system, OmpR family, alkaline phosphatase synthesis response regulator PhoP
MSAQVYARLPLVLVAHRTRDTVELLKALLEGEGFTTLCAYNGRAALQYAHQHHPALLLLDQALPLLDGIEICRILRQETDSSAIFILSDKPDELGKLLAFASGADDCLALPFHPRELLARIKAVLRRVQRQSDVEHHVLRSDSLELDPDQRQVHVNGEFIELTGLEYELLYSLMKHAGHVFSRAQILEQVRGFQHNAPLDRAVDIHVSNLRRKLASSEVLIETVRGVGYRLNMQVSEVLVADSPATNEQGQLALAAFEHVPLPLLVITANRTVVLYNEAAKQLCGWSADEVIGQVKCYSLLLCHHEDGKLLCKGECVLENITLNHFKDYTAQYSIMLKDGREMPATVHYTNLGLPGTSNGYMLLTLEPTVHSPE